MSAVGAKNLTFQATISQNRPIALSLSRMQSVERLAELRDGRTCQQLLGGPPEAFLRPEPADPLPAELSLSATPLPSPPLHDQRSTELTSHRAGFSGIAAFTD
jgi:hypothetical protein